MFSCFSDFSPGEKKILSEVSEEILMSHICQKKKKRKKLSAIKKIKESKILLET